MRASLEWETFCELRIPMPSIDRQRELAAIYRSLLNQIVAYEQSIPRLQKICEDYISEAKKKEKSEPIGTYLGVVDIRNSDKSISVLRGLNIDKVLIPSVANVSQTDLGKYKVVKKDQFAYSAMQVGRDGCIRVSLYSGDEPIIVSPAYTVFEVLDPDALDSDYLMMWLKAPETDRMGWFKSDGSVRASLEWNSFCELEIPLPSSEKQRSIVAIYNAMQTQKEILQKLKDKLVPLCPVLAKGAETD